MPTTRAALLLKHGSPPRVRRPRPLHGHTDDPRVTPPAPAAWRLPAQTSQTARRGPPAGGMRGSRARGRRRGRKSRKFRRLGRRIWSAGKAQEEQRPQAGTLVHCGRGKAQTHPAPAWCPRLLRHPRGSPTPPCPCAPLAFQHADASAVPPSSCLALYPMPLIAIPTRPQHPHPYLPSLQPCIRSLNPRPSGSYPQAFRHLSPLGRPLSPCPAPTIPSSTTPAPTAICTA